MSDTNSTRTRRSAIGNHADFEYDEYYDEYEIHLISNIEEATENTKTESVLANFVTEDVISEAELSKSTRYLIDMFQQLA